MRIWAGELSALTHPHPMNCVLSSLCCEFVYVALIAGCRTTLKPPSVTNQLDKKTLAKIFAKQIDDLLTHSVNRGKQHIAEIVDRFRSYRDVEAWAARGSTDQKITGTALDAFETALWCFFTRDTFKKGAMESVSLGGDSAAIRVTYGAIAGAYYGYGAIPLEWVSEIHTLKVLEDVVDGLGKLWAKRKSDGY